MRAAARLRVQPPARSKRQRAASACAQPQLAAQRCQVLPDARGVAPQVSLANPRRATHVNNHAAAVGGAPHPVHGCAARVAGVSDHARAAQGTSSPLLPHPVLPVSGHLLHPNSRVSTSAHHSPHCHVIFVAHEACGIQKLQAARRLVLVHYLHQRQWQVGDWCNPYVPACVAKRLPAPRRRCRATAGARERTTVGTCSAHTCTRARLAAARLAAENTAAASPPGTASGCTSA